MEDVSLPSLFEEVQLLVGLLDSQSINDTQQEELERHLHLTEVLVDKLSLFSRNEELIDVASGDLKYLLVPFYQAEALYQKSEVDREKRVQLLDAAKMYYTRWLQVCEDYGILDEQLKKTVGGAEDVSSTSRTDSSTLREQKIARFRKEKQLAARIDALKKAKFKENLEENEADRELWLLKVEQCMLQGLDHLRLLQQEQDILKATASLPKEELARRQEERPTAMPEQLAAAVSSLTDKRAEMKDKVFRQGHNLPTVSLRQQAEWEMQHAQQATQADRKGDESADDDEETEESLRKKRDWDDWKDDNPRGWGNKQGRS